MNISYWKLFKEIMLHKWCLLSISSKKFLADRPSCPKGSTTLSPSFEIPRTNTNENLGKMILKERKKLIKKYLICTFSNKQLLGDVRINLNANRKDWHTHQYSSFKGFLLNIYFYDFYWQVTVKLNDSRQRCIKNTVKRLRWRVLWQYLTTNSR